MEKRDLIWVKGSDVASATLRDREQTAPPQILSNRGGFIIENN